jgi:nitroreductase
VAEDPEDGRHRALMEYDLGQATANMMSAATDLGIGSAHAAVGDQDRARRVLGFAGGHLLVFLVALGYPAGRPLRPLRNPDRRPFDEVVHWESW